MLVAQLVRESPVYMEPESSSSWSQGTATGPCPQPGCDTRRSVSIIFWSTSGTSEYSFLSFPTEILHASPWYMRCVSRPVFMVWSSWYLINATSNGAPQHVTVFCTSSYVLYCNDSVSDMIVFTTSDDRVTSVLGLGQLEGPDGTGISSYQVTQDGIRAHFRTVLVLIINTIDKPERKKTVIHIAWHHCR
jgi:hypothetical protein